MDPFFLPQNSIWEKSIPIINKKKLEYCSYILFVRKKCRTSIFKISSNCAKKYKLEWQELNNCKCKQVPHFQLFEKNSQNDSLKKGRTSFFFSIKAFYWPVQKFERTQVLKYFSTLKLTRGVSILSSQFLFCLFIPSFVFHLVHLRL